MARGTPRGRGDVTAGRTSTAGKVGFAAAPLVLVAAILTALHSHEGRPLKTYWDALGQVWTVCAGVTGEGVIPGKTYTPAECDALEQRYVARMLRRMGRCVTGEFDFHVIKGMGHFAYNVGETNFCASTAARLLNAGDVPGACRQITRWVYVKGKDCRLKANKCDGIPKRREWERATCEGRT